MKWRLIFGCVATVAALGKQPAQESPVGGFEVDVCMEPAQELGIFAQKAKPLVAAIYSQIGVKVIWHAALSECDDLAGQSIRTAFKIRWEDHAPYSSPAGALAAARPYASSGTSITIYEAAVQQFLKRNANAPEVVLAYVLAHELAHVMQGHDHHSASGILKTNWSYREYYMMLSRTLTFTAEDMDLIRAGLAAKMSRFAKGNGAPGNPTASIESQVASSKANPGKSLEAPW